MRPADYGDDSARREAYKQERTDRWTLEDKLREPLARMICGLLEAHFDKCFTYALYADDMIAAHRLAEGDKVPIPGFIIGAPDFQIDAEVETWYVELK